jgi:hypothetical protein
LFIHGVGKEWPIETEDVDVCTITDGEFDLQQVHPDDMGQLEKFFGKFENHYHSIISTVGNRQMHDKQRDLLIGMMASLIVRSVNFRRWMAAELAANTRDNFFKTIGMYLEPNDRAARVDNIYQFAPEVRLNHATYIIWHHLYHRLVNFNMVFIHAGERGWETSDDPVVLRNIEARGGSLLGRASELYFPLSREWCLFMYDPKSRYPLNPLCKFSNDSFVLANDWIRFAVREFVMQNANEKIFFSGKTQYGKGWPVERRQVRSKDIPHAAATPPA